MNKFLIKLPNDSVYISILLVPILAIFQFFFLKLYYYLLLQDFYIKFIEIKNFTILIIFF